MAVKGPLRFVLICAGTLSLALGSIGVVMPVLPTTPFVLVSAYCFYRSSDRLHTWLVNHHRFGPIILRVKRGEGITLRVKLFSLASAYTAVGTTMILADSLHLTLFLSLVLITKTVVMIRIPTYRPQRPAEQPVQCPEN